LKKIFIALLSFLLLGSNSKELQAKEKRTAQSVKPQFKAVWDEVISDSLSALPQESVSYSKLFDGALDSISLNAKRTLSSKADIIEPFNKLVHPNGVCLSGIWKIDTKNPYSGQFKKGSESLVIARASTALSATKRGETRAFGMAIKLFGTTNKEEVLTHPTANFFVIDDLGGTDAQYYTDVALTNEPDVSFTSTVLSFLAYGLKVSSAFSSADTHSGIRQLYELSYLGEEKNSTVITPKWIKIEAEKNQRVVGAKDFREEFNLVSKKKLVFNISVASRESESLKQWEKIGTMTFDTSSISQTCDHRLHFHHPLWRDDLVYE